MRLKRLIGGGWSRLVDNLERWFPERQVFYRRRGQVNFVSFSRGLQISFAGLLLIFSGWVGYSSIYYLSFDWILRDKNRQLAEARVSYRNVMDEVANYNDRLMSITHNLEATQTQLLGLFGGAGGTGDQDGQGKSRYADLDRAVAAASHRQFTKQIQGLEKEWRELTARNATLEHGLASIGNEVETVLAEHGIVTAERDRLRTRVRELEVQVTNMRTTEDAVVSSVTERTTSTIDEVERVISMTGLKVDKLVAEIGDDKDSTMGQGGPLIAVKEDDNADPLELKVAVLGSQLDRWNRLRRVLRHLPLAAPLDHYRMSSTFGVRRDPITSQLARHNGIDLTYELNTPIMNTAPGKVVFTGWRPGLGWTVEIDHGMGIRTRYGHMRTILAKQGDEIGFRDKVGLLGNSGRSTGPHVHYEILVNGKPVDPTNFIMAGKYVFKG